MFDFTKLAATETAAIHLKKPDGQLLFDADNKPVRIVGYGPGSKQFAIVEDRQRARAMRRMQANDGKVTLPSVEQQRAEEAEDLADLTVSFENIAYPPAGEAQGTQLYRAFYADPTLGHYTKQFAKQVADWANFTPGSSAN